MTGQGWDKLLTDVPRYGKANPYWILAYSEMMPAPLIGWRPYGTNHPAPRSPDNPHAWLVSEREQVFELGPGLQHIAGQVLAALKRLDREQPAQGINREILHGNIYWPEELAGLPGAIPHERYVTFLPLAFSKTQDDKARVRWTFFGGSEQGPERAFWKSFYSAPGQERRPEYTADFVRRLLRDAYGEKPGLLIDLRQVGFRILPGSGESACRLWRQAPLPSWTAPFLFRKPVEGVKYLLTFRPFGFVPKAVRQAYLEGRLHLLPFPGSLIFWGAPRFLKLQSEFPQAMQIPLLNVCARPCNAEASEAQAARSGYSGRLAAFLLSKAHCPARNARQGHCRRPALPVANRFRLPLDGRLACQPGGEDPGTKSVDGDPRKRSLPRGDHGRSL